MENLCRSPLWELSAPRTSLIVAELASRHPGVDMAQETRAFLAFAADQREPIKSCEKAYRGFISKAEPRDTGPPLAAVHDLVAPLAARMDMGGAQATGTKHTGKAAP